MSKFKVVIAAPAANDLQGIVEYIAIDLREPVTAKKELARIREAVLSLADYPTQYALVADEVLAAKGYRMLVVDNYLIFYITSITEETVTVIKVLYNRRDWINIL